MAEMNNDSSLVKTSVIQLTSLILGTSNPNKMLLSGNGVGCYTGIAIPQINHSFR
ncbi:hypothetical protein HanRHA438_Chr16g0782471 [Helianthus annuus]|nr:hypothetical protein HanRHA438_Chr16g0782471 [Helianthus annuus]